MDTPESETMPHEAFSYIVASQGQDSEAGPGRYSVSAWAEAPINTAFMHLDDATKKTAFATACHAHNRAIALATQIIAEHNKEAAQNYIDYLMGIKPIPDRYTGDTPQQKAETK